MAIEFYFGSGSPYAWRVWLALEHKALAYETRVLSFDAGDLNKPFFVALNPRHKVPVIVDRGFSLYESAAIVEYLEDAYPASGGHLFPLDIQERARARRLIREADEYLARAMEAMVDEILNKPRDAWSQQAIGKARDSYAAELGHFERELVGDFFAGAVGAVDFTIYPLIALAQRMEKRHAELAVTAAIGPRLAAWMDRIESLPYYAKTYPPHWRTA